MSSEECQFNEEADVLTNASELAQSLGIKIEQVYKFTQLFIQTAKCEFIELEKAINNQDLSAIATIGHRLKSSSLTVGASQFSDQSKILEAFSSGGDIGQARDIFTKLQSLLKAIEIYHNKRISITN